MNGVPRIERLENDGAIERAFATMRHLRPHLVEAEFLEQIRRQEDAGYHLAAVILPDGTLPALAGYRFAEFLAWGRVLYLDDLVTHPDHRGHGYAGRLLEWLEAQAREQHCDAIHLDSGPTRHDAHRLYLNHGFQINSHHFAKALNK